MWCHNCERNIKNAPASWDYNLKMCHKCAEQTRFDAKLECVCGVKVHMPPCIECRKKGVKMPRVGPRHGLDEFV